MNLLNQEIQAIQHTLSILKSEKSNYANDDPKAMKLDEKIRVLNKELKIRLEKARL